MARLSEMTIAGTWAGRYFLFFLSPIKKEWQDYYQRRKSHPYLGTIKPKYLILELLYWQHRC